MKFSAAAVLFCLGAAVALVSAQDDFDYGEDAAGAVDEKLDARPPPAAAPRRPGVLSTGPRKSPLARSRATVTSTTPAPPPPPQNSEEEELEEGELEDEGEAPVTEASTKKPLIRGGVRPFRSNQDLLEALKRRRQNIRVSTHSPEDRNEEESTSTAAPARRRFNGAANGRSKTSAFPSEAEEKAAVPKARTGRRFSGRGRVKEEEEQQAAPVVEEEPRRTGRRRF